MAGLQSRIIVHGENFDASGFTDQNSLVRAMMDKPDQLTPIITMLMGAESNKFPLSFLTEGQKNGTRSIELNNIQYEYPVMGKMKTTEVVVESSYVSGDKPGINFQPFYVVFPSQWFPNMANLRSMSGTSARVMSEPVKVNNGYRYCLQLHTTNPLESCSLVDLSNGAVWGRVGASNVTESRSSGSYEPLQTPGKRKNQINVLRHSYQLAGNISNKVVEFRLMNNGVPTNLFIDYAEYQFEMRWRELKEQTLWLSKYNRNAEGQITMMDQELNQPIPTGAGLMEQIPNSASYSTITEKLIRGIIGDVFRGVPDTGVMDIILYCGIGFREEFDIAMKNSSIFKQVAIGVGDKFVTSVGGNLQLGGYFTSYRHVDGHVVTLKALPLLDYGGYADVSPKHPTSGLPMSSYEAYFVDQSIYDGQPNLQMVHEKGRMQIRGLHQGMSLVKGSNYGDYKGNSNYLNLATPQDQSSVHYMATCGIQMLRDTHSFKLIPAM